MAKKKTIAGLVEQAATILQRIVRMKAADENGYCTCVTCGKVDHYKNMDGAHFISRVKTRHKLLEENIHVCCKKCNGYLGGNYQAYTLFMVDTYGRDFVDELLETQNNTMKWMRSEILDHIQALKKYEKEVRDAKGL